jgi:hypothetical protein
LATARSGTTFVAIPPSIRVIVATSVNVSPPTCTGRGSISA